jgi:GrpB-like predicted nucleotidyltransferase (UPF0157 family)
VRKVEVVDYRPEWPALFEAEAARIAVVFGEDLLALHHIGSTSVRGMAAKPVIDILGEARDILAVDSHNDAMRTAGFLAKGEYGLPGRRFFIKSGNARACHVHIYQTGHPDIERHLAFRDYLRTHPEPVREYATLKRSLAARFPADIDAYCDGKDSWVKETERIALAWRRG